MSDDVRRAEFRIGGLRLVAAAGTQVGNRYPANFDVLHLDQELPLVVVADGMGGGRGSAVAGRTTVDVVVRAVTAASLPIGPAGLRAVVAEAQSQVRAAGDALGELTGCTLTAFVGGAADDPQSAWIVQVGDSRAYRMRGGLLELLTVDHTAAWMGAIYGWFAADSPEAAAARYRLTRYIGHHELPEPDVLSIALRPGDVICLCTDGIAEQVTYERLAAQLDRADPEAAVAQLLVDTLAAGGHDNATVAVIRVDGAAGQR